MSFMQVVLATNNGDIGGGEVMLLALARQLRNIGVSVQIVGPAVPSGVVDAARAAGHPTVALDASGRSTYMIALRRWRRRHPEGVLWCNGLVPAVATAFTAHRVVHLHQLPTGLLSILAKLARHGSIATLVPSRAMSSRLIGTLVLENWVEEVHPARVPRNDDAIRIGFLGRTSVDKGVPVLAAALCRLEAQSRGRYRLVLAGEPRFVDKKNQAAVEQALAPVEHLVERHEWMPREEFFGLVDMMVCPSVWCEPFGLVVAEAMSARIPFVVSDAGALPEVAGPNHPWIARAGVAVELAEMIEQTTENDGSELVAQAYERWRLHYSPTAGRKRLCALLEHWDLLPDPTAREGTQ